MAIQRSTSTRVTAVAPRPGGPPQQRPAFRTRSRAAWTFFAFFLCAVALIGGEVVARYQPDVALKFKGAVANLLGRLPETTTPEVLFQLGAVVSLLPIGLLIWQAGASRRPLYIPLVLFLCAAAGAMGLYRGGRDLDLERNLGRLQKVESDLGAAQKQLEAANGSLQKSGLAVQERDETLTRLRAELEALKSRLTEKEQPKEPEKAKEPEKEKQ